MKLENFHTHTHTLTIYIVIVGIKESSRSIGPWVIPKDAKEPKDDQIVR